MTLTRAQQNIEIGGRPRKAADVPSVANNALGGAALAIFRGVAPALSETLEHGSGGLANRDTIAAPVSAFFHGEV